MAPVDLFLQSVRDVFARNREADWVEIGSVLGGAVVVSITVSLLISRHRRNQETTRRIDAVTARARLGHADLAYLGRIARNIDLALLEVMTRLAAFERATSEVLALEVKVPRPEPSSPFDRVRRLRQALGFSPLPGHHWLLSTRELMLGDPATLGSTTGKVVEVNEACFAVDLPAAAVPAIGGTVNLAIVRPDDSRYLIRAGVLAAEPVAGPAMGFGAGAPFRRVFFVHDEQPERQQNREHVRVRVRGAVSVRIVDPGRNTRRGPQAIASTGRPEDETAEISAEPTEPITGTLVDVSAGGMALDLPISPAGPVRRGARLRCSFALADDAVFTEVAAIVAAAVAGPRTGVQHLRLSFFALADAEQDRLSVAVAKRQRTPPAESGKIETGTETETGTDTGTGTGT